MPSRVRTEKHVLQPTAAANKVKPEPPRQRPNAMQAPLTAQKPPGTPLTVPKRDELSLFMHPGLTDACSLAHVFRNIANVLYTHDRVDVGWDQEDSKYECSCPTYRAMTEHYRGIPQRPFVTVTWRIGYSAPSKHERARVMVATTDSSSILTKRYLEAFADPKIAKIIVLSPECQRILVESGIPEEKIEVFPLGVDQTIYKPAGPTAVQANVPAPQWLTNNKPTKKAFVFLCAGYMQPRKGVAETVEAFCKQFAGRTDVALVIKHVCQHWGKDGLKGLPKLPDDAPPVGVITDLLSEYQMAALLRDAGCFVNAHHREGFGMMPLQAMACGTPIITTNYHGPTQYATKANSYLLPVTSMGLAQDTTEAEPVPWAFYDTDELGRLMASVLSPKTRQAKVAAGLTEAAKWTWDRSATRLMQIVQENIGYVHRRPPKWVHPKVTCSVVMPVRNASPKLRTTLDTLYNLKQPDEVFVYDDASSADEGQAIREIAGQYDRCTVLRGEKQVGCHEARRILFEQARGLYIASIDGDMDFAETDPEWQYMLAALLKEHRAGIVHPLLVYPKWHDKYPGMVHSAGSYVKDTKAVFDHRFIREPVTDEAFRPTEVAVCCGAFQFFRADLLNSIVQDGVYWPAYFGDADFAYRARAAGNPVWYCPQVVVGHDANSWGQTEEGKRLANWGETSQRFMERWADMVADDLLRQDETGALR